MTNPITSVPHLVQRRDAVEAELRGRVRDAIEAILEEELASVLGAAWYGRAEQRRGYRNGAAHRRVITEYGAAKLRIPRGRLEQPDGTPREWHSEILPRYQRRTRQVDATILGCYLAGANSRRIRRALSPLWGERTLSKSAVSRVVLRLRELFDGWRRRELQGEGYVYLYLDGMRLPVRIARRVVKVPVLAVVGVREDGQKVLVTLDIAASESTGSWTGVVTDLAARGLPAPALVICDGNAGLLRAIRDSWPHTRIQRCTNHKRENLLTKVPQHSHAELTRDYNAIVYAPSLQEARTARERFVRKWRPLSSEVVKSLEEAGPELLTFYDFPQSQWKVLRTTNAIERLNGEFRRRTKTQGSFRNEQTVLVLLYGLVISGQIRMRRLDGWSELVKVQTAPTSAAA